MCVHRDSCKPVLAPFTAGIKLVSEQLCFQEIGNSCTLEYINALDQKSPLLSKEPFSPPLSLGKRNMPGAAKHICVL